MRPALAALLLPLSMLTAGASPAQPGPLLQFALDQPYEPLPADSHWRERVVDARRELALAGPMPTDCASGLGAARRAALLATLSRSLSRVGATGEALDVAVAATRCAPRDAAMQALLAYAALDALRLDVAAEAIGTGLQLAPNPEGLQRLAIELGYLRSRWQDVLRAHRSLPRMRDTPTDGSLALLALAARHHAAQQGVDVAAGEPEPEPEGPDDATDWPGPLWQHLVAGGPEQELVAAIEAEESPFLRPRMLCEALVHLGELAWVNGEKDDAQRYYAAALRTKALGETTYRLARWRLQQLRLRGTGSQRP